MTIWEEKRINNISGVVALVGTTTLLLSLIYNAFFFLALDINLFGMLSVEDHLMAFLTVLPGVGIMFIFTIYINYSWFFDDEDPPAPDWKLSPLWEKNLCILAGFFFVAYWLWFATDVEYYLSYFTVAVALLAVAMGAFLKRLSHVPFNFYFKWFFLVGYIALGIALVGYGNASSKIKLDSEKLMSVHYGGQEIMGKLIRSASGGVVIQSDADTLYFIPRENIDTVSLKYRDGHLMEYRSIDSIVGGLMETAKMTGNAFQSNGFSDARSNRALIFLAFLCFSGAFLSAAIAGLLIIFAPHLWPRSKILATARFYRIYMPKDMLLHSRNRSNDEIKKLNWHSQLVMARMRQFMLLLFMVCISPILMLFYVITNSADALLLDVLGVVFVIFVLGCLDSYRRILPYYTLLFWGNIQALLNNGESNLSLIKFGGKFLLAGGVGFSAVIAIQRVYW